MIILNDGTVLGALELEHVFMNVHVERQGHTFANLVVNTSKSLSQIASCVETYEYKIFIIKIYNVYCILCTFKHANPQKQRFVAVGLYMNLLFTSVLGNMQKS